MEKEDKILLKFVGLHDLDDEQKKEFTSLAEKNFEKIKRKISDLKEVIVHIKIYKKEGERQKFDLNVRCRTSKDIFESKKGVDWDLSVAMKKSFTEIEKQLEHKLHVD